MLVRIAEHVVSLDVGDEAIRALCAPFAAREGARAEACFSAPDADVAAFHAEGMDRARQAFAYQADRFYRWLLPRGAICLHASAIAYEGRAYLFSAASGTGKSTHAGLWRRAFGSEVHIINDDTPILARRDSVWFAYGAPWCGKDDLGENISAPVAGICSLVRDERNSVRRLHGLEAFARVFSQTPRLYEAEEMARLMDIVEALTARVPIYELRCDPSLEAARTAREALCG